MSDWNQKTADYIQKQVTNWSEEFFTTPQQEKTPLKATFLTSFAEKVYEDLGRTPKTWVGYGVKDVYEKYFLADFATTHPLLLDFIDFLGEKGYLKNASTLLKALKEIPQPEVSLTEKPVAKAKKEKEIQVATETLSSQNPFNQKMKQLHRYERSVGKKKNRKKHRR